MAVTPGLAEQVEELFASLGAIRIRRMFGALGVYCDELFFAIADDGMIYLKADDASEPAFREAGSEPFTFTDKDGVAQTMRYWRLPDDAFDDRDEARRWGAMALDAARRAKAPKRRKPR